MGLDQKFYIDNTVEIIDESSDGEEVNVNNISYYPESDKRKNIDEFKQS